MSISMKAILANFNSFVSVLGTTHPMEYQLASSSTEETHETPAELPFYKSHLRYYYYPGTARFIGRNTIPRIEDFTSSTLTSKMKKELRAEYPSINFSLLERNKEFFGSRFKLIGELKPADADTEGLKTGAAKTDSFLDITYSATDTEFILRDLKENPVEILRNTDKSGSKLEFINSKRQGRTAVYDEVIQQCLHPRGSPPPIISKALASSAKQILILEDSVLEALSREDAYIFLRVVTEDAPKEDGEGNEINSELRRKRGRKRTVQKKNTEKVSKRRKYVFEDVYYKTERFYEYLNTCAENWIKSFGGQEMRLYEHGDSSILLHSSTVVRVNGEPKRIFNGIDVCKNAAVIFNRTGPSFIDVTGKTDDSISLLTRLDLEEGDYVINNMRIYRPGDSGEEVPWSDIDFSDFISGT